MVTRDYPIVSLQVLIAPSIWTVSQVRFSLATIHALQIEVVVRLDSVLAGLRRVASFLCGCLDAPHRIYRGVGQWLL